MIRKIPLIALITQLLTGVGISQESSGPVQVRVLLHDPVRPRAELFMADQTGGVAEVMLNPGNLSEARMTIPANGSIVLYDKVAVDPANPAASLAASAKMPSGTRKVIAVVTPAPAGAKPPYRMVLIDDSKKGFPDGESRVLSLVPVETAVEAGEHKLQLQPGKVTRIPAVKKHDEFNMAPTNFYYKEGSSWVPFTERKLQFLDVFRRVFVVYVTPGSTQPFVRTVVDTAPAVQPES